MPWLRMIPSEEARKTHRGVRRYFQSLGEPIELSETSGNEDIGLEEPEGVEDEEDDDGGIAGLEPYGEEELDIFEGGVYGNHE